MKSLIFIFFISFYVISPLFAKNDSIISALKDTSQMRINSLGSNHLATAKAYHDIGDACYLSGKYPEAIEWHNKALKIQLKNLDENHLDVAQAYHNMARSYYGLANYDEALKLNEQALKIRIDSLEENHSDIANSYNNIAVIYNNLGLHTEELKIYEKILKIWINEDENSTNLAMVYNNLARAYASLSNYSASLHFHEKAKQIWINRLGENHADVGLCHMNIAICYKDLGDYERALILYKKTLKIWSKELGENHPSTIECYNRIAIVYDLLGNHKRALALNEKALQLWIDVVGKNHVNVSNTYNSMANIHRDLGNYDTSIKLHQKALEIKLSQFDENHAVIATTYYDAHVVYSKLGKHEKALELINKSLKIWLKQYGENHPYVAHSYLGIGNVNYNAGNYQHALNMYNKASEIWLKQFGESHNQILLSNYKLAKTYEKINNQKAADSIWYLVINQNLKRLNKTYLFLSDNQRLEYAKTFKDVYNSFYSFAAKHGDDDTKKLAAYLSLNTKSLALDYSISARKLINSIDDEELKNLHDELKTINKNISQAESMTSEEVQDLDNQQQTLTEQLLKNKTLKEKLHKTSVEWENAQSKLKSNEAIVDFVRFYEESDSTWVYYVMLTKNKSAPQFLPIANEKAISAILQAYDEDGQPNYIQSEESRKALYRKIWQPVMPHLESIKTVHLSPAGLLHRIDFDVLQNENGTYLADDLEFHYYTTIRDFAKQEKTTWLTKILDWLRKIFNIKKYKKLLLFGDIAYDSPTEKIKPDTTALIVVRYRNSLDDLPNTGVEIDTIGEINGEKRATIYITGNAATEDTVKHYTGNRSPDILHYATHGTYLRPSDTLTAIQRRLHTTGNPLQRSIVALSGANKAWTSKEYISRSDKDGILTAYEVSHLDLSETKLVVLSACETALGDIHDTEGVLGLQSAFKLAGVQHVVVSLWKVNDTATKDLMILFYQNLLNKKQDTATALRNAKAEMRNKGAKPQDWAGFILIE